MSIDLKKLLSDAGLDKISLLDALGTIDPACQPGSCQDSCTVSCSAGCDSTNQPGGSTGGHKK